MRQNIQISLAASPTNTRIKHVFYTEVQKFTHDNTLDHRN
jgi:hypothetical protein